eukprot:CAMPEP_0114414918 /NCGR_PEP_ID=MMETSP0103-20121206/1642_1 /TAXON_ID=37642 ORGANISM="Paraphysomonas imperforata, Strain PA2" /NCGR_SAMPLE_ID=MMETSP0103 /ASSEMBLY_ACC=CAM_ASM_000201 /LENGTH=594 /DNA_ID=CAMNT_0001583087 /DNA_START=147 /DNA_END=1931 /DNA_ORIENTATION=+
MAADQDPDTNPLPIGLTIQVAPYKSFIQYNNRFVIAHERLPKDVIASIAGRSGIIISAALFTSKHVELRRISVLTKDGMIQCQNVPARLLRKKNQQTVESKPRNFDPAMTDDLGDEEENDSESLKLILETRKHMLSALTEAACRSGKQAVKGDVNAKECAKILNSFKEEVSSPTKQPETEINSQSGPTSAVIGDNEGLFDPIGTCLVSNSDIAINDKSPGNGANQDGKMFSIEKTMIHNYPETEEHLDEMATMNETFEQFSGTVKAMLKQTENHASGLKQYYKNEQRKSNQLHKKFHKQKKHQKKSSRNIDKGEDIEEPSNSEFIFLNSIQEAIVDGYKDETIDCSQSINSLSTTFKLSLVDNNCSRQGRHKPTTRQPKSADAARHLSPRGNSTRNSSSSSERTLQPPCMQIHISHLQPQERVGKKDSDHMATVSSRQSARNNEADVIETDHVVTSDEEGSFSRLTTHFAAECVVVTKETPVDKNKKQAVTPQRQLIGLNPDYEYLQRHNHRSDLSSPRVTNEKVVSPFVQRIIPRSKIATSSTVRKSPCKPFSTPPSAASRVGSRGGKKSQSPPFHMMSPPPGPLAPSVKSLM